MITGQVAHPQSTVAINTTVAIYRPSIGDYIRLVLLLILQICTGDSTRRYLSCADHPCLRGTPVRGRRVDSRSRKVSLLQAYPTCISLTCGCEAIHQS